MLITGVLSNRSIAYGIARACHDQGAELAFTYLGESLERRVRPLAESVGASLIVPCDVEEEGGVARGFGGEGALV